MKMKKSRCRGFKSLRGHLFKMKLIFLGPPGAGKGSVAREIIKEKGIPQISTGDLIRASISENSEAGKKAKEFYDQGKLVPDEIIIELLKERISQDDCKNGFILDGFPRTIPQAEALDKEIDIDKVINFKVSDETILSRLSGRRICEKCGSIYHLINIPPKVEGVCDECEGNLFQRKDDNESVIKKRLEEYQEKTAPLIYYYDEKGNLVEVELEGDLLKNVRDTLEVLNSI
jgi:adenylate kinase